ncbi:uncharacterized protein LOC117650550 [Thrips palmi]|uniref:Uncharacterized protein LOC117650550 n=1 Tax=Thrips palmi TaxID=161013 RepID=A0A6P8ZXX5_THRPL|nr:uncharacterized protein LOC117650550 [Thrips palmi]
MATTVTTSSAPLALLAVVAAVVALAVVPAADACNGFRLVVKKAETKCADGTASLLTMRDFGVTLTPDCKFIPRGCVKANKGFGKAQVKYVIKTSMGMPLAEGEKNACEAMAEAAKNPDATTMMDLFQLPKSCPVEAGERCADGKVVDVAPWKDKLVPGSIKAEVTVTHEDGMKSCIGFEGALKK